MQSTTIHFHICSPAGDIEHTTKLPDEDDLEQIFMLSGGISVVILIIQHPSISSPLHIPVEQHNYTSATCNPTAHDMQVRKQAVGMAFRLLFKYSSGRHFAGKDNESY